MPSKVSIIFLTIFFLFSINTFTQTSQLKVHTIQGIDFPETVTIEEEKLYLNGLSLRRMYMVRIYVAGLYLRQRTSDPKTVLESKEVRRIHMVFLRDIEKEDLIKSLEEGIRANCKNSCDSSISKLKDSKSILTSPREGKFLILDFYNDRVKIDFEGEKHIQAEIKGQTFSKTLLSVFIGKDPPSKTFRAGLFTL